MAFDPNQVQYPTGNIQHMFDRHKADWGFAGQNWNNANKALFQQAVANFIGNNPVVHAGTYHGEDAWLVVEQAPPYKCAIVHRPDYNIWSGWNLSAAQFNYANNPPYSLGGGALLVFGKILEDILVAKDHENLDELTRQFLDTYKAHGSERYDEVSEKTLMDFFAVMDNYVPPHLAEQISGNSSLICDLNEVKKIAQQTLATLEKQS